MKKIAMFLVMALSTMAVLAKPKSKVQHDLQKLLAAHSAEMQAIFSGMDKADGVLPVFFSDVSFANDRQVESFLRNVSSGAPQGQVYSQVSFTQFVSIGGNMRSVSYNLVNSGGNVTFVKSANINGQMLKAVYEFDAAAGKLKAGTFDGEKLIKQSEFSI
jgi:hypothetical protein